jgi:cell division protein ZapA
MSEGKTIKVSILDIEYQVSCQPSEVAALQKSAGYLDAKMREMKDNSSVIGLDRLAVMAALNITNDFLALTEKADQLAQRQTGLDSLTGKVDSALRRLKT